MEEEKREEEKKLIIKKRFLINKKSKLGKGYSARVYGGVDLLDNKKVAIKMLNKEFRENQTIIKAFKDEAELLKGLNHERIIKCLDYNEDLDEDFFFYMILEFAENKSLAFYLIDYRGGLPEEIARLYFFQLLEVLEYLRELNISHRDLSLNNILLDEKYNIKLCDFGFSTINGKEMEIIKCGTRGFKAPEIHEKIMTSGFEVDYFSAGVILFYLTTGQPPFKEASYKKQIKNSQYVKKSMKSDDFDNSEFYENTYLSIKNNQIDDFWCSFHADFDPDLKILCFELLRPAEFRPKNFEEVKNFDWMKGELATEKFLARYMPSLDLYIRNKYGNDIANNFSSTQSKSNQFFIDNLVCDNETFEKCRFPDTNFPKFDGIPDAPLTFFFKFSVNNLLCVISHFAKLKNLKFTLDQKKYSAILETFSNSLIDDKSTVNWELKIKIIFRIENKTKKPFFQIRKSKGEFWDFFPIISQLLKFIDG